MKLNWIPKMHQPPKLSKTHQKSTKIDYWIFDTLNFGIWLGTWFLKAHTVKILEYSLKIFWVFVFGVPTGTLFLGGRVDYLQVPSSEGAG